MGFFCDRNSGAKKQDKIRETRNKKQDKREKRKDGKLMTRFEKPFARFSF